MGEEKENVFYYLTVMNENYVQPEMPKGSEEGIIKGIYLLDKVGTAKSKKKVKLLGSGTILLQVREAADLLKRSLVLLQKSTALRRSTSWAVTVWIVSVTTC